METVNQRPYNDLYERCARFDRTLTSSELSIVRAAYPNLAQGYFEYMKKNTLPTLEEKLEYVQAKKKELVISQQWEQAANLRDVEKRIMEEIAKRDADKNLRSVIKEELEKLMMKEVSELREEPKPLQEKKEEKKEEYFTPSIEDIRVGYECEANMHMYHTIFPNVWKPMQLVDLQGPIIAYAKSGVYRVPYLTASQIEKEGWKPRESNKSWKPYFDKGSYSLLFHERLEISGPNVSYLGECKDINTFRLICKLLGI